MNAVPREADFGPEWSILERLCLDATSTSDQAALRAMVGRADLRWGELMEQAVRHGMLPMLAHAVISLGMRFEIPRQVFDLLVSALEVNRWRIAVFRQEAVRVVDALEGAGIRCVATKGITFESTLYGGNGTRPMSDIDFLIAPADRDAALTALRALGYEETYDWTPRGRQQAISYRLHPDHLPKLSRATGDPFVGRLHVDVANSLTWSRSDYEVPVEVALEEAGRQEVPGLAGVSLPCLSPMYQLVFTILHLFREAWMDKWLDYNSDVTLLKFGDVIRLCRAHEGLLASGRFRRVIETLGIEKPTAWVLEHLDRTFGTAMTARAGLTGWVDAAWLASAQPRQGQTRRWTGTMRERLASRDRRRLLVEDPPAGSEAISG